MSPDRSSTYDLPSGNESNATRPPCFWNCDTDAGEVLKIRHGALPAVIAAPMTSSELFPVGISCAVTFWSAWAAFHAETICLPQATSSALFDNQTVIGPRVSVAELSVYPPPHAAVAVRTATRVAAVMVRLMVPPTDSAVTAARRSSAGAADSSGTGARRTVGERGSQLCPATVDAATHRADLDTEQVGDLLVRQGLQVAEYDGGPQARIEGAQRELHV